MLGISASDLVFLGYPDGVLAGVYADSHGDPVRSPTTGRTATYGPIETDYHTLAHGRPAAYTRVAALDDIVEVLRQSQPKELYVTFEFISSTLQSATCRFVTVEAAPVAARFGRSRASGLSASATVRVLEPTGTT